MAKKSEGHPKPTGSEIATKVLDVLKKTTVPPVTTMPTVVELPTGVTSDQIQDMRDTLNLIDIIIEKKPE